jgi:glycosyltransferase involved in cell wall biosynthesis
MMSVASFRFLQDARLAAEAMNLICAGGAFTLRKFDKMRIAYLVPEFPGQTHIFFWREMAALTRRGIETRLVSTRRPPNGLISHTWAAEAGAKTVYVGEMGVREALSATVEFARCGPTGWFRSIIAAVSSCSAKKIPRNLALILCAARFAGIMRREKLSHIHAHSCGDSALLAMLTNRLSGVPYSLTLHGPLNDYGDQQNIKFRHAAFAIAITRTLQESIREKLGSDAPAKIGVVPMGVDPAAFSRKTPFLPWDGGPLLLFSCGRLNFVKGHQELIESVALIRLRGIDARLSIAGEDDLGGAGFRSTLTALIDKLDLRKEVTLLGAVSEHRVFEELQRAHLFVLASHSEPLGVAIMEALSCGVPVISTNAGGVPDLIDHERDGYLVEPKSAVAIANAVSSLIKRPALQQQFSTAGRNKIIEKFHSNVSATELQSLLVATSK